MNKRRLLLFGLTAVAVVVYANALWNGFAYDDNPIIVQNARVHHLAQLKDIWLTPYWPMYGVELGLYRPLTIFGFAVQWALVGNAPWLFHLVNILMHAGTTVLLFLLIEQLASRRAALFGALIFAVHPLHTESVANVVGQAELWAALTTVAACVVYVRRTPDEAVPWGRVAAILGLYALGLLAKESAVVLPGLLLLLDVVQGRVRPFRRYLDHTAFLFLACAIVLGAYLTLRVSVLGNLTGVDAAPGLPFLREHYRLLNAFRAWPEYVRLLFVPWDLSADYGPGVILPVDSFTPMVLLGALLLATTIGLTLATPWQRYAGLIAGWFLLAILPVANLLFPIGVLIAERTLYLPSVAVCFLAGFAFDRALQSQERARRVATLAAAAVITVAFAVRTVVRNPDWSSLEAVWHAIQRDHPEAYRSQWASGSVAWLRGYYTLAEEHYLMAVRMWPRDSQLLNEIGNFYIAERKYHTAVDYLERSRRMTPFIIHTSEFLAYAYLHDGRPRDALHSVQDALKLGSRQYALLAAITGGSYDRLGEPDRAAGAWRVAIHKKNGDLWLNWAMLARALARGGHVDAALAAADTATTRAQRPEYEKVVRQLQTDIRSGCYARANGCDALAGWVITVPTSPQAMAKGKATAKRKAKPGSQSSAAART